MRGEIFCRAADTSARFQVNDSEAVWISLSVFAIFAILLGAGVFVCLRKTERRRLQLTEMTTIDRI